MVDMTDELIKKLEQISTETYLPLEKRMIDLAVWFHKNKDRIPREELPRRLDFLETAFNTHLELMALLVERQQLNEGRRKSDSLWLPNGMKMIGDDGKEVKFG